MSKRLRVKICGLTTAAQAQAIAQMGVDALGFICVPDSPRYIAPQTMGTIVAALPTQAIHGGSLAKIGVFADAPLEHIQAAAQQGFLTGVQLHGQESLDFCQTLRAALPHIELIKAFRIRTAATLTTAQAYGEVVDTLLLDAFNAQQLGGTGETWDWSLVQGFTPACPWLLAGGLNPDNVADALAQTRPSGIDVSSGVERAPGQKDLQKVHQVLAAVNPWRTEGLPGCV